MSTPDKRDLVRALDFAFEPDETAQARIGAYQLLEKSAKAASASCGWPSSSNPCVGVWH
jgi:hypothetical protein